MQTGGVITADQATEIVKVLTEKPKDTTAPTAEISTSAKLEKFIHFCRAGTSVTQALKDSGILTPEKSATYIPGVDSELAVEELFYGRVASKNQPVMTDEQWMLLTPEERAEQNKLGAICVSQLYKLVDWLYFNRTIPIKAIAASLQVSANEVAAVKAAISNDFAKVLKSQNGEAYIGDLLRTKELIKADIASRKAKLPASDRQHAILDRLIWEIDNKFIDRLQEIGYINKSLGRIDVHEEWEVTIGAAGQPVNTKLKNVSQFDADRLQQDETIDVSTTNSAFPLDTNLNPQAKALAMPIPTPLDSGPCEGVADKGRQDSAFIKVGTDQ